MTEPATAAAGSMQARRERWGRRAGSALFGLVVAAFTGICAIQILVQVFAPRASASAAGCREQLGRLQGGLERARRAAATSARGEAEALVAFRRALEPDWADRAELEGRCTGDPGALRLLGELDRLRYAEEHAVRYEASELARQRLRVTELAQGLGIAVPAVVSTESGR